MPINPSDRWFWNDWDNDLALRVSSLAAQGLWMRLLSIAARAEQKGFVAVNGTALSSTDIATLVGHPENEVVPLLAELERNGVFSRDRKGRIYNRRMVRDAKARKLAVKFGKTGGNPVLMQDTDKSKEKLPPLTPQDNQGGSPPRARNPIPYTHTHIDSSLRSESKKTIAAEFDEAWKLFPLKRAKGRAFAAWMKARKAAPYDEILNGILRFAAESIDSEYVRHPATWLNDQGWLDEAKPQRTTSNGHARETAAERRHREARQASVEVVLRRERERNRDRVGATDPDLWPPTSLE